MNDAFLIIPALVGGVSLSAVWLWTNDRLYTLATGKAAAEREVGGASWGSLLISRARYIFFNLMSVLYVLLTVRALGWSHSHSDIFRSRWLVPLFLLGVAFYTFHVKWHRQHSSVPPGAASPQSSGPAT